MYKKMDIKNFRIFHDQNIVFGKYITIFSGRNSTGKSTLLGMIANSGELKKADGVTYLKKPFRAEFGEIFKGSQQFDKQGSDRFTIVLSDEEGKEIDKRTFRTAWQATERARRAKKGLIPPQNANTAQPNALKNIEQLKAEKRFRVIPENKNKEKKSEAKFKYPILYLGLSRLFPIGESKDVEVNQKGLVFLNDEHKQWFVENYIKILSIHSELKSISDISINETDKKVGIGITTENYDYLTNSAGQDNLGQILLALLSFKKLKEKMKEEWVGGVLLIDELDATLHPAAQIALMKVLIQEARKTGIQIMFTTHSLTLLESICSKTLHNCNADDGTNGIELYYLTNANRKLKIKRNISYNEIENDLKLTAMLKDKRKIKLYSEDDEARWFIKHLLGDMADEFDFVEANIGCNELMRLYKSDMQYFGNTLIIFDGDVKEDQLNDKIGKSLREAFGNIVSLMGEKRPEEVLYDYIMGLDPDHEFWAVGDGIGLSWDYFKSRGPESYDKAKSRENYKIWFKDNLPYFEAAKLMDFWIRDNESVVDEFKQNISKIKDLLKKRMIVS